MRAGGANHKNHMQAGSNCRRCMREVRESSLTCGSCNQTAKQGETLHCYDQCLAFITETAAERLRMVQRHGDCTICLQRDHDSQAHLARAAGKTDKMLTCGLYNNTSKSVCKRVQNAAFHGAEGHAEYVHKQFHARTRKSEAFPRDVHNPKDTGKSSVRGDW